MTDAREVHGAAEAWRVSLPLEHDALWLAFCSNRDSLSFAVEISANDLWLRELRHVPRCQLEMSTTKALIGEVYLTKVPWTCITGARGPLLPQTHPRRTKLFYFFLFVLLFVPPYRDRMSYRYCSLFVPL